MGKIKDPARGQAAGSGEISSIGDDFQSAPKLLNSQANNSIARLKFLAQRLHALGPKPLFHFLDELERGAAPAVPLMWETGQ